MTKTTVSTPDLDQLDEHALRALVRQLMGSVEYLTKEVTYLGQDNQFKDARIRKLKHEIAVLRRYYFGKRSEELTGVQGSLLDEAVEEDMAAIELAFQQLQDQPGNFTVERHIRGKFRPIDLGRKNCLFAGSLRAGQRAAAVMSLIQSAKLNGHDPYAYLKDVLMRLPTQQNSALRACCSINGNPFSTPIKTSAIVSGRQCVDHRTFAYEP